MLETGLDLEAGFLNPSPVRVQCYRAVTGETACKAVTKGIKSAGLLYLNPSHWWEDVHLLGLKHHKPNKTIYNLKFLTKIKTEALIGISSLKSELSLRLHLSSHCGRLKRTENSLAFLPSEGGVSFSSPESVMCCDCFGHESRAEVTLCQVCSPPPRDFPAT